MGRCPTLKTDLPPHMPPRKQRNGKVYFYMYQKERDGKRKEIPLGDDFTLVLKKYAELNVIVAPITEATFEDLEKRYLVEAVPRLTASSVKCTILTSSICYARSRTLRSARSSRCTFAVLRRPADIATTVNRCKRVFPTRLNRARGWADTDLPNPCEGIQSYSLEKRTV